MTTAREDILTAIRGRLGRGALDKPPRRPAPGPVPAQAETAGAARTERFRALSEGVAATVVGVASLSELPSALSDYLADHNLPAGLLATRDPMFDGVPWDEQPMLEVRRGDPGQHDMVVLSRATAAIAETGTLVMAGDRRNPHLASFLPETAIVVLSRKDIVGGLEDAWAKAASGGTLPRTISLVTGPSRTGDIELKLELGAHGPRRVHIVIVDDDGL